MFIWMQFQCIFSYFTKQPLRSVMHIADTPTEKICTVATAQRMSYMVIPAAAMLYPNGSTTGYPVVRNYSTEFSMSLQWWGKWFLNCYWYSLHSYATSFSVMLVCYIGQWWLQLAQLYQLTLFHWNSTGLVLDSIPILQPLFFVQQSFLQALAFIE